MRRSCPAWRNALAPGTEISFGRRRLMTSLGEKAEGDDVKEIAIQGNCEQQDSQSETGMVVHPAQRSFVYREHSIKSAFTGLIQFVLGGFLHSFQKPGADHRGRGYRNNQRDVEG